MFCVETHIYVTNKVLAFLFLKLILFEIRCFLFLVCRLRVTNYQWKLEMIEQTKFESINQFGRKLATRSPAGRLLL